MDDLGTLVERAAARDVRAFLILTRRFQNMVHATALAVLGDVQAAEDASQETILAAWAGLPTLAEPAAFPGWLRRIARRLALRQRRGMRADLVPIEQAGDPAAQDVPADDRLAARQDAALVLHWLGRLPANLREPALLYYVHDCSQQDIAAFLNLPLTSVNNRLHAARMRLKRRRLTMVEETLRPLALDDAFARRIGRLLSAGDGLVDILFDPAAMPDLLTELSISDERRRTLVTAQVTQRREGGVVRAMPLTPAPEIERGATVLSAQRHIVGGAEEDALRRFIVLLGELASDEMIETDIKAIDLLCPIPVGGAVVLAGEAGTGLMVLMEELVRRLVARGRPCSLIVLVPPAMRWGDAPDEAFSYSAALREQGFSEGSQGLIETFFLRAPPLDWSAGRPDMLAGADVVIRLTREQAERDLWPAIDPQTSGSRLIDQDSVTPEHRDLTRQVLDVLARRDEPRAALLAAYLTQPFLVAEPWSGRPGISVSLTEAMADVARILKGELDELSPEGGKMTGRLPAI